MKSMYPFPGFQWQLTHKCRSRRSANIITLKDLNLKESTRYTTTGYGGIPFKKGEGLPNDPDYIVPEGKRRVLSTDCPSTTLTHQLKSN